MDAEEPDWDLVVAGAIARAMRPGLTLVTHGRGGWSIRVDEDARVGAPELRYDITLDRVNQVLTVTHGNTDAGAPRAWQHATVISLHAFRLWRAPIERELERIFREHPPNQHGFS